MKKLFVAVAAVMAVSATAFSGNNKMTNNAVDVEDTVVVDSSKTQALADDTVTSDTVVTTDCAYALADDTVTTDTVVAKEGMIYTLALADDTVKTDTVVTAENMAYALAKIDEEEKSDTTTTKDGEVKEVIEKAENKFSFIA